EHEGVEAVALHDAHLDASGAEASRFENRLRVVVEDVLDLGVANKRDTLRRSGGAAQKRRGEQPTPNRRPRRPRGNCADPHRYVTLLLMGCWMPDERSCGAGRRQRTPG